MKDMIRGVGKFTLLYGESRRRVLRTETTDSTDWTVERGFFFGRERERERERERKVDDGPQGLFADDFRRGRTH